MDDTTYDKLVASTFRRVEDALADCDPDLVEVTATGDMLTMTGAQNRKVILNTQRAVHQLWLPPPATAWHFSWHEGQKAWQDDKGRGELWPILCQVVNDLAGRPVMQ